MLNAHKRTCRQWSPGLMCRWDHHADKALNKDALRMAIGAGMCRLPTRVRLLMLQTFVYSAVTYGAEVWDTQLMRERMSVVRRACAPSWDCTHGLLM
jgi:hypothetical protein